MKNFEFILGKEEKKNTYFNDIFNTIRNICPWANKTTYKIGTPVYLDVYGMNKTKNTNDALALFKSDYGTDENLYNMFKTFTKNEEYMHYLCSPTYDYKIGNIPVKIHGNFIQIGSEIIPKYVDLSYFKKLNNETKTTIYNIIINIENYTIAA